jgi:stage III sporulation protein AA
MERALSLLPAAWRHAASRIPTQSEELRLRVGRKPSYLLDGKETVFLQQTVEEGMLQRVLEKATGASLHTAAPALSEGYFNSGGVRIGICGVCVLRDGQMRGFRSLSSLAIRIPREHRDICRAEAEEICRGGFGNTLIIGRPGAGKTTALRELIRLLSLRGYRVGVADERNEIAAREDLLSPFDLGPCTDVLTGTSKAEGAMMLLRGMNPQILAMDEITHGRDLEAVEQLFGCGIGILASVHGESLAELRLRERFRELLLRGVFQYALLVQSNGGKRSYCLERII